MRSQNAPSAQMTRAMLRRWTEEPCREEGTRREGQYVRQDGAEMLDTTQYILHAPRSSKREGETHQTVPAQTELATTSAVPAGKLPSILPPSSQKPVAFVCSRPTSASWRMAKAP